MEFGLWLARKRLELGERERRRVTMTELAKRADVSRQYVSFLESGVNPTTGKPITPDREVVRRLARALGEPEEEALGAAGYAVDYPPEIAEVASRLRRLTASELSAVRQLVEQMTAGRVRYGAYA